ncbi:unknown [Prevotella sp. CAG:1124]|nr:unknown [Prevotella sp. CAG:1124]
MYFNKKHIHLLVEGGYVFAAKIRIKIQLHKGLHKFFAKKLKCVKPGSSRLKNLINRAFYNENISTF